MQKHWNKPFKKIERNGVVAVNNECLGIFDQTTTGIVVDHIIRKGEHQLKPFRTSNINLHTGASTIAIFRIVKRSSGADTKMVSETDAAGLF